MPAKPGDPTQSEAVPPGGLTDPVAGGLRYEVVDVFADRPFAGNPLAVVYGADALNTRAAARVGDGVQPVRDGVPRRPD